MSARRCFKVCHKILGRFNSALMPKPLNRSMASTSSGETSGNPLARTNNKRNRLHLEKSSYLLQHASNPVDWYPWGEEAFERASQENKPIFLSVGYSTCHWCHVMEKESFENEEVGKIMNEHFVCIKVDREERPDVDKVYMSFIQALSGGGGWPMSVFLTPELKPIYGGTYFPPDDRYYGRPGFKTVLQTIAKEWNEKRDVIAKHGQTILDALSKSAKIVSRDDQDIPPKTCTETLFTMLESSYDAEFGGFSKQPKFPQPVNLNFLFRLYAQDKSGIGRQAMEMALFTLKKMAMGGIHDHIYKGFHRYSTDQRWHVPHFEKMLYDQAQLVVSYLEGYQISHNSIFADTARDILHYVNRDLSHSSGCFYSAEDADSLPTPDSTEKREGAFCVWSHAELKSLLSQRVSEEDIHTLNDVFCYHYGVKEKGNVDPYQDPHDELKNQNVLIVTGGIRDTADHFKLTEQSVQDILLRCHDILFECRRSRPKPHLDTKVITSWNGLMISGYAKAGQVLNDVQYSQRASQAAEFIKNYLYTEDGLLLRSCYVEPNDGTVGQISKPIQGFAEDYTFVVRGLIDLYETVHDQQWLTWAEQLQGKMDELFWDPDNCAYFTSVSDDPSIVLRMKDDQDGAEPSSNSVAASNLLRLSCFLNRPEWRVKAEQIFKVFGERLRKVPIAVPEMMCALMVYHQTIKQIIILGDPSEEDTQSLIRCVNGRFLPNKVLIVTNSDRDSFLSQKLDIIKSLERKDNKPTAYVCENFSCSLPVTKVEELEALLSR